MKKSIILTLLLAGTLVLSACGKNSAADNAGAEIDDEYAIAEDDIASGEAVENGLVEPAYDGDDADAGIADDDIAENGVLVHDIPETEKIEKGLDSFITWAGLQSFYDGMSFETLPDDAAIAMAAFTAQSQATDVVLTEEGDKQIIAEADIEKAMNNLFGKTYDIASMSKDAQEKSMLEVQADNSINITLGDWGLTFPKLEILAIDPSDDSSTDFTVNARYYPFDAPEDKESVTIPSYCCVFTCSATEDSEFGFIIKDMKSEIVEP